VVPRSCPARVCHTYAHALAAHALSHARAHTNTRTHACTHTHAHTHTHTHTHTHSHSLTYSPTDAQHTRRSRAPHHTTPHDTTPYTPRFAGPGVVARPHAGAGAAAGPKMIRAWCLHPNRPPERRRLPGSNPLLPVARSPSVPGRSRGHPASRRQHAAFPPIGISKRPAGARGRQAVRPRASERALCPRSHCLHAQRRERARAVTLGGPPFKPPTLPAAPAVRVLAHVLDARRAAAAAPGRRSVARQVAVQRNKRPLPPWRRFRPSSSSHRAQTHGAAAAASLRLLPAAGRPPPTWGPCCRLFSCHTAAARRSATAAAAPRLEFPNCLHPGGWALVRSHWVYATPWPLWYPMPQPWFPPLGSGYAVP
jgi:hypothetical protein